MTTLELRRDWIAPGKPDPWGDDERLLKIKQLKVNGQTPVRAYVRGRAR
jgi:hypothetical protein